MGLLTAKRRPDIGSQSLTQIVDATFAFVDGSRRLSGDFVQDLFLVLGVIAETLDASTDVRRRSPMGSHQWPIARRSPPATSLTDCSTFATLPHGRNQPSVGAQFPLGPAN